MKLSAYVTEIQKAVEGVIRDIYAERKRLAKAQEQLRALTAETESGYERAEFIAMNPDLDDDGMEATAVYWDTYFGADKERDAKAQKVQDLANKLTAHQFSVDALSGSLLQFAKQGLALRFGKNRNGIPVGRAVHGIATHEIVWQGRNQAIHWEEGAFHPKTDAMFKVLAKADGVFADYTKRSMAFEIVALLGWRTFADFKWDMLQFDV